MSEEAVARLVQALEDVEGMTRLRLGAMSRAINDLARQTLEDWKQEQGGKKE